MKRSGRVLAAGLVVEPVLAVACAVGLCYAMWHLWSYGYLPQPFFYSPFDMWGDWFNVVYWAYDKGTYDAYGAVYPPLSFVFLKIFSIKSCYPTLISGGWPSSGLEARKCDWLGIVTFHVIFLANIVIVAMTFVKNDRNTAPWRAYALCAGFPMLQAFEHANLVMLTFMGVVLTFGPLIKSARLRWLFIGLAINLKIYVIATIFPQLLRRRWRWVEGALISTVCVYLTTYAILGRGTPMDIYNNITAFAGSGAENFLNVWFPATNLALQSLLDNWESPIMGLIGSHNVELLLIILPTMQHIVQAAIVLAAVGAWLRPEVVTRHRLTNLGISLALITTEAGGYTVPIIFFFTFLEKWKGFAAKWAIVACYILCIPGDIPVDKFPEIVSDTFIPNGRSTITFLIMIGPFIRPTILLTVPFALSLATISDVWHDIRVQGWRTRWRFRRDARVMAGPGQAIAPAWPASRRTVDGAAVDYG